MSTVVVAKKAPKEPRVIMFDEHSNLTSIGGNPFSSHEVTRTTSLLSLDMFDIITDDVLNLSLVLCGRLD